jgi:hypothetical protein
MRNIDIFQWGVVGVVMARLKDITHSLIHRELPAVSRHIEHSILLTSAAAFNY